MINTVADTNTVYHSIYEKRYSLDKLHVDESMDYISKNLQELSALQLYKAGEKISLSTVGTGREVKAWANLGVCYDINHFDISEKAVEAVQSIKDEKVNITSNLIDLCCEPSEYDAKAGALPKADLIYLSGVWHHLEQPLLALRNLATTAKQNAVFMLRIYRSQTARWDLVQTLRENYSKPHPEVVIDAGRELFANLEFGDILKNAPAYYVENYIDNMVVPYCHLFDSHKVTRMLESLGAKTLLWTNPHEEGNCGYLGEQSVPNGSTVVFQIENPADFQENIMALESYRADKQGLLNDKSLNLSQDGNKPLDDDIIGSLNQFDDKQIVKLCLLASCLLESPYIAARFREVPAFYDKAYNDMFQKLAQSSGPSFVQTFRSVLRELIRG